MTDIEAAAAAIQRAERAECVVCAALAGTPAPAETPDIEQIADGVRWGFGAITDYWRGFNDGIDALVAALAGTPAPAETPQYTDPDGYRVVAVDARTEYHYPGIDTFRMAAAIHNTGIANCRNECGPAEKGYSSADHDLATILIREYFATPDTDR